MKRCPLLPSDSQMSCGGARLRQFMPALAAAFAFLAMIAVTAPTADAEPRQMTKIEVMRG